MEFLAVFVLWIICELYMKYVQYKIDREERRKDEEARKIMEIAEKERVRYHLAVPKEYSEYIPHQDVTMDAGEAKTRKEKNR